MKFDFERTLGFFGIMFGISMFAWLILHYALHVL